MPIMRLGRAELRVLDLEKSVDYYTNVIGVDVVDREEGKVYLKAWDEWDHHSVILQEADSPGLNHLGFKVESLEDMIRYEKRAAQFGCTVKRISNRTRVGEGEAIRIEIPTGRTRGRHSDQ